jgi:hypothetical protein
MVPLFDEDTDMTFFFGRFSSSVNLFQCDPQAGECHGRADHVNKKHY